MGIGKYVTVTSVGCNAGDTTFTVTYFPSAGQPSCLADFVRSVRYVSVTHRLSEAQLNRRGLLKLMLRMPEVRERLQALSSTNDEVLALCGAFEDASSTLEKLRRDPTDVDLDAILEYEGLCRDIEHEILEICS